MEGFKSLFLQDSNGQIKETSSISAGLDYSGVGPQIAYLQNRGRIKATYATDKEVLAAYSLLAQKEGMIGALESCHAIAEVIKLAPTLSKDKVIVFNLSGRGDKESKKIAKLMIQSKVKYLEIQIPFSDPIADGVMIMNANNTALQNGITPHDALRLMSELQDRARANNVELLFMTYYNIVFRFGLEDFCKAAKTAGCYGLIIPDIPIDEEKEEGYIKICKKHSLNPIQVISPITPITRLQKIQKYVNGFVYCVSNTGLTGSKNNTLHGLEEYIQRVRENIPNIDLAVGFGISSHKEIQKTLQYADIAVIGSKILRLYDEGGLVGVKDFLS